ncbi:hypothetical protein FKM82_023527 [Ascaphus truei]
MSEAENLYYLRTRNQLRDKCRAYGLEYVDQEVEDMVVAVTAYEAEHPEVLEVAQLALLQPPGDQGLNPVPGWQDPGEGPSAPPRTSAAGGARVAAATSPFTPEMLALITAWGDRGTPEERLQFISMAVNRPAYGPPVRPPKDGLQLDKHSLTKYVEGTDQIDMFLRNFETQCRRTVLPLKLTGVSSGWRRGTLRRPMSLM